MAKEIRIKAWKSVTESLVIPYKDLPPILQKRVNGIEYQKELSLTLSIPDSRGDWIEKWYKKAKNDDKVVFRHHKTVTICSADWGPGDDMAISDVCKGDTYDRETGIAVAYAKFRGEPIPKFI